MRKRVRGIQPLSNVQIMQWTGCQFVLYEQMKNIGSVGELLNPYTLILYQLADVGHFCCIFRDRYNQINFFDPIGHMIDDELGYVENNYKPRNHGYPYLLKLLADNGQPVIYNQYAYQRPEANVCGHWCTLRMLFHELTCDEFHDRFRHFIKKDFELLKYMHYIFGDV